jgi:hypothetical protein
VFRRPLLPTGPESYSHGAMRSRHRRGQVVLLLPVAFALSLGVMAVWGSSASDVFAVGFDGTILRYDARTWFSAASAAKEPKDRPARLETRVPQLMTEAVVPGVRIALIGDGDHDVAPRLRPRTRPGGHTRDDHLGVRGRLAHQAGVRLRRAETGRRGTAGSRHPARDLSSRPVRPRERRATEGRSTRSRHRPPDGSRRRWRGASAGGSRRMRAAGRCGTGATTALSRPSSSPRR